MCINSCAHFGLQAKRWYEFGISNMSFMSLIFSLSKNGTVGTKVGTQYASNFSNHIYDYPSSFAPFQMFKSTQTHTEKKQYICVEYGMYAENVKFRAHL